MLCFCIGCGSVLNPRGSACIYQQLYGHTASQVLVVLDIKLDANLQLPG